MKPEHQRIFYIVIIVTIIVLAIILGLVFGLRKSDDEKGEEIDVLNSYDNTDELIKKYPVINNTTVLPGTIKKNPE